MPGSSSRQQYRMEERRKMKARKQERQTNNQEPTTTTMGINEETPRTSQEQEEGSLLPIRDEENDPILSSEDRSSTDSLTIRSLRKDRGEKALPAIYDDGKSVRLSASLTTNTYSLIYVSDPKSFAFLLSIFLFGVQTSLPALVMVDLIDSESEDNPLGVPVDVSRWVRMAGYIALVLSIPAFEDLLDAIERLHEGYHVVVMKQSPHATFWWVLLSCHRNLFVASSSTLIMLFNLSSFTSTCVYLHTKGNGFWHLLCNFLAECCSNLLYSF